jgi:hypothetical protein
MNYIFTKIKNILTEIKLSPSLIIILFSAFIFFLSIRGLPGNPNLNELDANKWRRDGPLEQTARFALIYSIVENHSFKFSLPLARFATPDLVSYEGNYVSLFPPGVSIMAIPGYLIGKYFGLSQIGTFTIISIFAVINILLIRQIAIYIGANSIAGAIAGFTFAFATPAYPYAVDFYQHHVSTFLILLSIFSLLRFRLHFALIIVWLCLGISVMVDYPNFLMMAPIAIYASTKFFIFIKNKDTLSIKLNLALISTTFIVILPVGFFLWFNYMSYGSPFVISAALPRVTTIDETGKSANPDHIKSSYVDSALDVATRNQFKLFDSFYPRLMLNGLYVHFISSDRGMLIYAPVVLFGFIGMALALKHKVRFANLLSFIAGVNILIYSMWGDPWGGWAFGSRYIIPSYAIFSIFIAYLLSRPGRYNLVTIVFFIFICYSIAVNTLGALTSSLNPPEIEARALTDQTGSPFKHTYERNIDFLNTQGSKSFIYNVYASKYITPWNYYSGISFLLIIIISGMLIYNRKLTNITRS